MYVGEVGNEATGELLRYEKNEKNEKNAFSNDIGEVSDCHKVISNEHNQMVQGDCKWMVECNTSDAGNELSRKNDY